MFNEIYLYHNIAQYLNILDIINLMCVNKEIFENRKIITKCLTTEECKLITNKFLERSKKYSMNKRVRMYLFLVKSMYDSIDILLCSPHFNRFMKTFVSKYYENLHLVHGDHNIKVMLCAKPMIRYIKTLI